MAVSTKGRTITLTGRTAKSFNEKAKHPLVDVAEKRDRFLSVAHIKSIAGSTLSNSIISEKPNNMTKVCKKCNAELSHKGDRRIRHIVGRKK